MTVLLTGANGFVGRAIRARLVSDGFSVVGLGRRPVGDPPYVSVDLSDARDTSERLKGMRVDAIVHAAANISHDDSLFKVNVIGTENVCNWAVENDVKAFVYLSSIPVVGRRDCPIVETMDLNPASAYHITKAIGERIVLAARDMRSVVFRFASPVGTGMPRGRIFSEFVHNASSGDGLVIYGDGRRVQNYIPVENVAEAISSVLPMSRIRGIYHLSGENISDIELARRVIAITQSTSKIEIRGQSSEEARWIVSGEKFANDTGIIGRKSVNDVIAELSNGFGGRG